MSFGRNLTVADLRAQVETHLKTWLTTYLAEAERQAGLAPRSIEQPRSWHRVADWSQLEETQLPNIAVTSPGTSGPPVVDGDGRHRATWSVLVFIAVRASTYEAVADLLARYIAAVRGVVVQHPSISGLAAASTWVGEEYGVLDASKSRTLAGGVVEFAVTVDDVVDAFAGPTVPPADPYAVPPADTEVLTVEVFEHPAAD